MRTGTTLAPALLCLALGGCSAISREISSLRDEENELADRLTALQAARKANVALVSALQQVQRDGGTPHSEAALARARADYAAARARIE